VNCSSTPKPADVSHCLKVAQVKRYDCVFTAHQGHFNSIYIRNFQNGTKVSGRITFVLSITRDGSVAEVHVGKSSINSNAFENDLLTYISKMNFGMNMAQHTIRIIDFPISD
jgi:hypothetical protein